MVAFSDAAALQLPSAQATRFTWLLVLCPSGMLWTAWLGKEAYVFAALGVTFLGLATLSARPRRGVALFVFGAFLLAIMRPQVGAIVLAVVLPPMAFSLARKRRFLLLGALGVLAVGYALVLVQQSLGSFHEASAYVQTVRDYNVGKPTRSGLPLANAHGNPVAALANVFLRPFPWEARTMLSAAASLEVAVLMLLVLLRLCPAVRTLWAERKAPLVGTLVLFSLLYGLGLGLAAVNLGLIARQRVHAWPGVLLVVAAGWTPRTRVLADDRAP